MGRGKGNFGSVANFELKLARPFDARLVVDTKSDLVSASTWPSDGDTLYVYQGMIVSVADEGRAYMLVDPSKVTSSDYSGWKAVGGGSVAEKMGISGKFNLATATSSSFSAVFSDMSVGEMKMYLVTDSSGNLPSTTETAVTVAYDGLLSPCFLYFGKSESFGVSVGDILVFTKLGAVTPVCRVISLNDAKAPDGDFPGADGLETVWDKSRINKIDGIEWTANNNRDRLNDMNIHRYTWGDTDMDDALLGGVYAWLHLCRSGLPGGIEENFTVIVNRSGDADPNYYTVQQTAYGRTGDAAGRVWTRVLFKHVSDAGQDDFSFNWVEISK